GVSVHHPVIGDITGHHGARSDEAVPAERDAAYHRCIRADRRPTPDERLPELVLATHVATRIHDVREDGRRTAEDVVFEDHAGVHGHVVLNLHVVADDAARREHDVLPEVAIPPDRRVAHDVTKMPDLRALPDAAGLV